MVSILSDFLSLCIFATLSSLKKDNTLLFTFRTMIFTENRAKSLFCLPVIATYITRIKMSS